jgi:hypothetical protein
MSKPYDPFLKANFHSLAKVREIFGTGADGGKAQKLFLENRPLYDQLRKDAEILGVLSPSRMPQPVAYTKDYQPPNARRFTDQEIELRGRYSEAECKRFISSSKEATELFEQDRDTFEARRLAAVSYGLVSPREVPYTPQPKAVLEPGMMILSEKMAIDANLPAGTKVTIAQFCDLITQGMERRAQEEADKQARANDQANEVK